MHGSSTLSASDRELIAAYVSARNGCYYCEHSHGATAACHLDGDAALVGAVVRDFRSAPISPKLKALLAIAGRVEEGGKHVTLDDVQRARGTGATDLEIHDTVLIAAAFCMYNRYVDGLGTWQPHDPDFYAQMGRYDARHGYLPVEPKDESEPRLN
jgi:uncharacterized peroxidase-related enzyme